MPAQPANLTRASRGGLALLCLFGVASVFVRIHAYCRQPDGGGAASWEAPGGPVDLGRGVLLPRAAARPLTLPIETCASPVSVDFARAGPYEPDPSLVGRPRPEDRVFYVYRGWTLGGRLITVRLNAIYFARRAYARVTQQRLPATDDLALKIVVPARCDAAPDEVMSVLRSILHRPTARHRDRDAVSGTG